jgi:serine/threonine protein phosphatase 1
MNRFLQLGVNKEGRDFVIGDIHGNFTQLQKGLEKVEFNYEKDRLIAVGDLIDRGKENMECLELIKEHWFYTVIGNHEMMMADALTQRKGWEIWINNGGDWYYKINDWNKYRLDQVYVPMIKNVLPVAIELTAPNGMQVGVTHTDTPNPWPWWEIRKHFQELNDYAFSIGDYILQHVIWSRIKINNVGWDKEVLGTDIVVHGHTPSKERVWRGNTVYIDHGVITKELIPINVMELLDEHERRVKTMETK